MCIMCGWVGGGGGGREVEERERERITNSSINQVSLPHIGSPGSVSISVLSVPGHKKKC